MKTLMIVALLLVGTVGLTACKPDNSTPTYNNANGD